MSKEKEEIKIAMYIRTKDGIIGKICEEDDIGEYGVCIDTTFFDDYAELTNFVEYNEIKKCSENIIDLIEVGDIVHYRINNISTTLETKGYIDVITIVEDENHLVRLKKDYNIEILEILTKEQYMQNCYKVKKEDI